MGLAEERRMFVNVGEGHPPSLQLTDVEIDGDELEALFTDGGAMDELVVENTSQHARFVEYGFEPVGKDLAEKVFSPYHRTGRVPNYDDGTMVENIRHWVELKFPGLSDRDKDTKTYFVVKKLLEEGHDPTYFLSDAVDSVMDRLDEKWDMDKGSMGVAEDIVEKAKNNLILGGTWASLDLYFGFRIERE